MKMRVVSTVCVIAIVAMAPASAGAQGISTPLRLPAAGTNIYGASTAAMIKNRAKTFGNNVSASGTRYFSVTDTDLRGKTSEAMLRRLSPPEITAADRVRRVEIVVDLQRPITLRPAMGEPVYIGTALVQAAALRHIEVHASIFTAGVTVVGH